MATSNLTKYIFPGLLVAAGAIAGPFYVTNTAGVAFAAMLPMQIALSGAMGFFAAATVLGLCKVVMNCVKNKENVKPFPEMPSPKNGLPETDLNAEMFSPRKGLPEETASTLAVAPYTPSRRPKELVTPSTGSPSTRTRSKTKKLQSQ